MKFLIDECLSPDLARMAWVRGHGESSHVVWFGRRFGGRDHTTVLRAIRKITRLIREEADIAFDVSMLFEKITGTQQ
jgi:chromosomal replication initiation ATPase DnaA